jgi:hypothetical protein
VTLGHATTVLAEVPADIQQAARDPYLARALGLSLVLDQRDAFRQQQVDAIGSIDPVLVRDVVSLYARVLPLGPAARVPLLDMICPALRSLSPTQLDGFRRLVAALATADQQLTSFELAMLKVLDHLSSGPHAQKPAPMYTSLQSVSQPIGLMLSVLARGGGESQSPTAFAAGAARLQMGNLPAMSTTAGVPDLARALDMLRLATPPVQRRVVDAAAHCIAADGAVRIEEAELLRAVCAALDVPVPPYLQVA